MSEPEKKKVTVRHSRRTSGAGKVAVKRGKKTAAATHIVDLKHPVIEEPIMEVAPQETVRPKLKENSWPFGAYKKIALSFIILAVAALAIVSYFAAVRLDIALVPKVKSISGQASFMIYDRPQDYAVPAGAILGLVRQMDIEYSATYPASGAERIGAEVSGTVTLVNKYSKDQPLVATTRLLTSSNQLLRLKDTVVVPAGGSIQAEVYGDSIDPSFTLADAKLTIPGLWAGLQDKIYAEAKAGAVSYKEKKRVFITQEDLDKAVTAAKQAITEKAASDIDATYADYDEKLYQTDDNSLAFSFDAKAGEEKAEFNITMSAKVGVVAFKKTELKELNKTALDSATEQGEAIIENEDTKTSFKILSADTADNVAQVEMTVDGSSTPSNTQDIVDRNKLIGLTRSQLESYLNSLETVQSYELRFHPSFFEIAPQLADKITISVKN